MPQKQGAEHATYQAKNRKEARRLYDQGLSERAVAEKMGMSKSRVHDYLVETGELRPRGRPDNDTREQLAKRAERAARRKRARTTGS